MFTPMPWQQGPQVAYNIFGGPETTTEQSSTSQTDSTTDQSQSGEFESSGQQQSLQTGISDQAVGSYSANFLPDFMQELSEENASLLRSITLRPYEPYTGTRVAPFNQDTFNAFDLARNNVGAYQPYFNAAGSTQLDVANRQPIRWPEADVASYMNPYTDQVINRSLGEINRQAGIDANSIKGRLAASEAYGGSATGIELGEHNRNVTDLKNNIIASLLERGFTDAAARFQFDEQNALGSDSLRLSAGQSLQNLGQAASQLGYGDAAAILDIGQQQQLQEQQNLDVQYQDFLRQFNYPLEMMQFRLQGAQSIPYAGSSYTETLGRNTANTAGDIFNINRGTDSSSGTSNTSGTTSSSASGSSQQDTGLLGAAGGLGSLAGGVGSLVTAFSSREYKEDIGKPDRILDRVLETPVHSWRYKPEMGLGTEMHIGPMAEDWKASFDLGDGKTINLVDGLGVTLEAIKQVVERVERLEA